MTLNGNVKEYAMKVVAGVMTASIIAGGGFAFKINNEVTIMKTQMDTVRDDIHEIKLYIKDISQGNGGLSENEARRLRQVERDVSCIRGLLSGETRCPPE